MSEKTWPGARFAHGSDLDCGIKGCSHGEPTTGLHKTATPPPPPLPNPSGGTSWYHGTSGEYYNDDEHDGGEHDDDLPGGRVETPDRISDEYGSNANHHWNTDLGVHFTSLHRVAAGFANTGGWASKGARVLHAGLHMGNPKEYDSEGAMGRDAIAYAHSKGMHFLPHEKQHGKAVADAATKAFNDENYSAIRHPDGHNYSYLDTTGSTRVISEISHGGAQARHHTDQMDTYLAMHPQREEITEGFREHLQKQGHDGITYGNEYEGPYHHPCAIAFPNTPIHHRKWQWLHPDKQHLNEPGDRQSDTAYYPTSTENGFQDQFRFGNHHVEAVQTPPEGMTINHKKKWIDVNILSAHHPRHGRMGTLSYLTPTSDDNVIRVARLDVDRKHRRKGVGSALMDELQRRNPGVEIDHGPRTGPGQLWWNGYTDGKAITRGRTEAALFFKQSVQTPPEGLTFEHKTGNEGADGFDRREEGPDTREEMHTLTATHPEHGAMGSLKYWSPRFEGDYISVHMLKVPKKKHQRKGVASALMDEMQRRHPGVAIMHGYRTRHGKAWWEGYTGGEPAPWGRTQAAKEAHLYHGTNADLKPGDHILPGRQIGHVVEDMGDDTHNYVWLTPNVNDACMWADIASGMNGGKPRVYRVHPPEHIESQDKDFIAPHAVVHSEVPWHEPQDEPEEDYGPATHEAVKDDPCQCCYGSGEHQTGRECYGCDGCGLASEFEGSMPCDGTKPYGVDNEGHQVELDPSDGWQHLDGSVSHDDGSSVTDHPVKTSAKELHPDDITSEHIKAAEQVTHEVRQKEHAGGQCGFVVETLQHKHGWQGYSGVYHSKAGEPIGDHTWNVHEPTGTIIDATADQWGEGAVGGVRIVPPDHPDHSRYRQAESEEEEDAMLERARALRKERGDYWWAGGTEAPHVKAYLAKEKGYEGGDQKTSANVSLNGQEYHPHEYCHDHPWLPEHKIFGGAKNTFDPRLFMGDKMKPKVKDWVMARIGKIWYLEYHGWQRWARIYLAGSEATYWWGNNDLDILIGIEHDRFREDNHEFRDMADLDIDHMLTQEFRERYNDEDAHVPFDPKDELWHLTAYVNPGSWDIRDIKPYGAYEILSAEWYVRPPEVPEDWNAHYWDESTWDHVEMTMALINSVRKLPEPDRTRQGAMLYEALHADRSRAFSKNGYGWTDPGNVVWKALDLAPSHPLDFLIESAHHLPEINKEAGWAEHVRDNWLDFDPEESERAHEVYHDHINRKHYQEGDAWPKESKVGWVKTESLLPYREVDRATEGGDARKTIDALKEDLSPGGRGWHGHVVLFYHHGSHTALLGEGNHRLAAAREVGAEYVPVHVLRASSHMAGYSTHPAQWDRSAVRTQPNHHGYVPGDMHPNEVLPPEMLHPNSRHQPHTAAKAESVSVAGIAIKAEDTGRVLLLQRSMDDEKDPARGDWEFPGGHLEDGEDPYTGGKREWCEETGAKFPEGHVAGNWLSGGIYQGFCVVVPTEDSVEINSDHEDRHVLNPDDPDGDGIEVVAWWEIEDLPKNPAVRKEVKDGTDWKMLEDATTSTDDPEDRKADQKVALVQKFAERPERWRPPTYHYDSSENDEEGVHRYFRGLYFGRQHNMNTGAEKFNPEDDDSVLSKIRQHKDHDNPRRLMWGLYGNEWTKYPSVARKFSLDPLHGKYRHPHMPTKGDPVYGAVIEAHSTEPHKPGVVDEYGEGLVQFPNRDKVLKATLHLHKYDPTNPHIVHDTYVRSFEIPKPHWRNASLIKELTDAEFVETQMRQEGLLS